MLLSILSPCGKREGTAKGTRRSEISIVKESKTPGKKIKESKNHSARRVRAKLEVGRRPVWPAPSQKRWPSSRAGGMEPAPWEPRACTPSVPGVHWSPSTETVQEGVAGDRLEMSSPCRHVLGDE